MRTANISQLFGTLQQSVVNSWKNHLKTSKYAAHMALDEYYKEMPELVDTLIENYQGIYGKVDDYKNILDFNEDPIKYLEDLRDICVNSKGLLQQNTELESDMDNILSLIDSTLYKLKELTESFVSLEDYIKENLG